MKLYRLVTELGDFFVIAEHPTEAEEKLKSFLQRTDYGMHSKREVKSIHLLATKAKDESFVTGHFLLT